MLLQLGSFGPLSVRLDEYPGQFAIRLDVQEDCPEVGLFLEHSVGGPTHIRQRLTPVKREDDGFPNFAIHTFVVPAPKDFGDTHYRCTWLNSGAYMSYLETVEFLSRRYGEGWGISALIPGMGRALTFDFQGPPSP